MNITTAKLSIRPRQMKVPVELLADGVHQNRVLGVGELIDAFCQKRNGKPEKQDGFDENDGELEVGRDSGFDALIIGGGMPAFAETNQNKNKIGRPTDQERSHEQMAELDDVIDLISVLGGVRRHADKLVDEAETKHICPSLLRLAPGAVRVGCVPFSKGE